MIVLTCHQQSREEVTQLGKAYEARERWKDSDAVKLTRRRIDIPAKLSKRAPPILP